MAKIAKKLPGTAFDVVAFDNTYELFAMQKKTARKAAFSAYALN
jgi:hypothetical protein